MRHQLFVRLAGLCGAAGEIGEARALVMPCDRLALVMGELLLLQNCFHRCGRSRQGARYKVRSPQASKALRMTTWKPSTLGKLVSSSMDLISCDSELSSA